MPASVARTPREERLWQQAKQIAADQGHAGDWAYIVGVFERLRTRVGGATGRDAYRQRLRRDARGRLVLRRAILREQGVASNLQDGDGPAQVLIRENGVVDPATEEPQGVSPNPQPGYVRVADRRGRPTRLVINPQGHERPMVLSRRLRKAADPPDAHWVTIGGHAEGDRRHVDGTAVLLDGEGRVIAGQLPRRLWGRQVRQLGRPEDLPQPDARHTTAVAQGRRPQRRREIIADLLQRERQERQRLLHETAERLFVQRLPLDEPAMQARIAHLDQAPPPGPRTPRKWTVPSRPNDPRSAPLTVRLVARRPHVALYTAHAAGSSDWWYVLVDRRRGRAGVWIAHGVRDIAYPADIGFGYRSPGWFRFDDNMVSDLLEGSESPAVPIRDVVYYARGHEAIRQPGWAAPGRWITKQDLALRRKVLANKIRVQRAVMRSPAARAALQALRDRGIAGVHIVDATADPEHPERVVALLEDVRQGLDILDRLVDRGRLPEGVNLEVAAPGPGAAAEYHPVAHAIRLSVRYGAHSFFHEYGHALDQMLSARFGGRATYSGRSGAVPGDDTVEYPAHHPLRPLVDYLKTTRGYRQWIAAHPPGSAKDLPRRYWEFEDEVFARWFAQWVEFQAARAGMAVPETLRAPRRDPWTPDELNHAGRIFARILGRYGLHKSQSKDRIGTRRVTGSECLEGMAEAPAERRPVTNQKVSRMFRKDAVLVRRSARDPQGRFMRDRGAAHRRGWDPNPPRQLVLQRPTNTPAPPQIGPGQAHPMAESSMQVMHAISASRRQDPRDADWPAGWGFDPLANLPGRTARPRPVGTPSVILYKSDPAIRAAVADYAALLDAGKPPSAAIRMLSGRYPWVLEFDTPRGRDWWAAVRRAQLPYPPAFDLEVDPDANGRPRVRRAVFWRPDLANLGQGIMAPTGSGGAGR